MSKEAHRQWYEENEEQYKEIKRRETEGKKLSIKECDFMTWWDSYKMTCPDPESLPRHSTMVVKKDKDPMED